MIALAVVALVCGTVLLIGYRAEGALTARWRADRLSRDAMAADTARAAGMALRIDERRVRIAEREIALKEQEFAKRGETPKRPPPMPDDIRSRITAWDDEFAQNEERVRIADAFAELGDWELVRKALPPLNPFLSTDNIAAPRDGLIQ